MLPLPPPGALEEETVGQLTGQSADRAPQSAESISGNWMECAVTVKGWISGVAALANNNAALDLKSSVAAVWWLGPVAADLANNNLAAAQVFILPSPIRKPPRPEASCKQHPSGMNILLA